MPWASCIPLLVTLGTCSTHRLDTHEEFISVGSGCEHITLRRTARLPRVAVFEKQSETGVAIRLARQISLKGVTILVQPSGPAQRWLPSVNCNRAVISEMSEPAVLICVPALVGNQRVVSRSTRLREHPLFQPSRRKTLKLATDCFMSPQRPSTMSLPRLLLLHASQPLSLSM